MGCCGWRSVIRGGVELARLMADANSAYRLEDAAMLRSLDEFELMMIEQPLAHDERHSASVPRSSKWVRGGQRPTASWTGRPKDGG